ncbi:hypothetical protein [Mycobacteroides abscessus]|uniref:hypothetical protein n=1 Tax=Mycobacteroides abscessus TaxID=36809 RepID=UPI000C26AAED|nr:hypothetical protein [Mycobacteroides abscessus]
MSTAIDWDTVSEVMGGPRRDHFGVYRNGNNQPLIMPAGGGKRVVYQRVTHFIEQLGDGGEGLRIWSERLMLRGLRDSDELRTRWLNATDDRELSWIATRAARVAGRDVKQEWGSMMHQLTQARDEGDMTPREWFNENTKEMEPVPPEAKRDADAYSLVTKCLTHHLIEQMHVHDGYRIAGTPDRVSTYRKGGKTQGRPKIADLKTGTLHPRMIEAQLGAYSDSTPYDVYSETRLEAMGYDTKVGIVIHLPMMSRSCELYAADLSKGRADLKIAAAKRDKGRGRKLVAMGRGIELGADEISLSDRIGLCANLDALRDVWHEAGACGELTEDFKAACLDRKQQLAPTK